MKLWSGRFSENTSAKMDDFHSSISFDCRMYRQDIMGSIAHAIMLGQQGIIPVADAEAITEGLKGILSDIDAGKVEFSADAEDIHMNIEKLLTERIGQAGKRLHTGRSRNDQVALDIRMYMMETIKSVQQLLARLCRVIASIAENNTDTIMPGYTHMQKAQPITLAHHMMAYFEMFKRDYDRLTDCYTRTNSMPLGSGALAGTTYPIDRDIVREQLGFSKITANSLDGVSDRDFLIEFTSCAAITMMHLSRLCEELVLWSTDEFKFIELSDKHATGSSIMPQKKNPDAAELMRGKTGRVYGDLMTLLTIMKSLPLAYNKDMQEDKPAVFDAADTLTACLDIAADMLEQARFNIPKMAQSASGGFTNATDAADYLASHDLPFRDAHEITGRMVLYCIDNGKALTDLSMDELHSFSEVFSDDIYEALSMRSCVGHRACVGGPAPEIVKEHIRNAKAILESM